MSIHGVLTARIFDLPNLSANLNPGLDFPNVPFELNLDLMGRFVTWCLIYMNLKPNHDN